MSSKTAKHPNGQIIIFTEEDHKYVSNGVIYKSATSTIKEFFPEFDKEANALRMSKKSGQSIEEILKGWEDTTQRAIDHGKEVHACLESLILTNSLPDNSLTEKTIKVLEDISQKIKTRYDILESEKIVFSPDLGLAGTMDLFARRKDTGTYVVADWKTNKALVLDNPYRQFGIGKLSHIPDNNFSHYSLQVYMYRELLIREGYVPKDAKFECIITHIPSSEDGVYRNHLAKDLSKEISDLLKKS